jgi:hypothetical protein
LDRTSVSECSDTWSRCARRLTTAGRPTHAAAGKRGAGMAEAVASRWAFSKPTRLNHSLNQTGRTPPPHRLSNKRRGLVVSRALARSPLPASPHRALAIARSVGWPAFRTGTDPEDRMGEGTDDHFLTPRFASLQLGPNSLCGCGHPPQHKTPPPRG